jgi:hypothetical protein
MTKAPDESASSLPVQMQGEPDDGVRDLAALCARLVSRLRKASPGDTLADTAADYLKRKRYMNPLRIKPLYAAPPQAPQAERELLRQAEERIAELVVIARTWGAWSSAPNRRLLKLAEDCGAAIREHLKEQP